MRTFFSMGSYFFYGMLLVCLGMVMAILFSALVINPHTEAATDYASSPYLISPPPPLETPVNLKIITFNIADGYLFTTNRRERMRAIGALLTELDPDLVGIQESFVAKDREVLFDALKDSRLRHHAVYPAATVGNGLLTLSAYPIVESVFHRYRSNNAWYKIHQGDWWAGKGVGLARVELPSGAHIDFYNTHAQAGRRDEANHRARYEQMGELAAFINESRSGMAPAFVVGDFNTKMGRDDFQRALDEADLMTAVTMDTGIDFILASRDAGYRIEVLDTQTVEGIVRGSNAAIFLSRAPGLREFWRMHFGSAEDTQLSDHTGFMSTIVIQKPSVSS